MSNCLEQELNLPQITVVMAVYNSERTLSRAIGSILTQTYRNWKLICVDDGSTDCSLNILKQYEANESRISVIAKSNGGPASARAVAYAIVDTPYVTSLDSDDCFSEDLLLNEAVTATQTGADSVAPNFLSQHPDGSYSNWNKDNGLCVGLRMNGVEAFKRLFLHPSMHANNLWKTTLVKKFALGDNATYNNLNADEYIQRLLFLNCKDIAFCDGNYIYHYNGDSVTRKFTIKQLGYIQTCKRYVNIIKDYNLDTETESIIWEYYFRLVFNLLIRYYRGSGALTKEERRLYVRTIREAYNECLIHKDCIKFTDKKHPIAIKMVTLSGYNLFSFICKLLAKH